MAAPEPRWTVSSLIGTTAAVVAILSILSGALWTYAGVTYATQTIPGIKVQQDSNTRDIAVLQEARRNSDKQYAEILNQFARLNDKLDRYNEARK